MCTPPPSTLSERLRCAKRDEATKRGETTYFYGKGKETRVTRKGTQQQALAAN